MAKTVRTRMAPSPTGYLHVGTAHTALFNWLFARHHGGEFILRIEDTDQKRLISDSVEDQLEGYRWLGLDWDEGPEVGGAYGPYYQSERLDLYHRSAQQLITQGDAYLCYCSKERLDAVRREQMARKQPIGYDRHCRNLTAAERAACEASGVTPVVRLKLLLEGQIVLHDLIRGDITFDFSHFEDAIILKSDGYPTYHLANVVDDHAMEISHIMRGDEWISSAPLHLFMYQAFGWEPPAYAHLMLLLDPSGKGKMSKRKTVSEGGRTYPVLVREFREMGYLPEAMINYLALLGWSYDESTEVFSREALVTYFDLDRVRASPTAFSYDKLEWMNGVHIRLLDPDDLARRLMPFLRAAGIEADEKAIRPLVPLIQERLKTLADAPQWIDFFFRDDIAPRAEDLVGKKTTPQEALTILSSARDRLASLPSLDHDATEPALRGLAEELGMKPGALFAPVRVAITGKTVSPPLFESMSLLGKERVLRRLERAITMLGQ